MNNKFNENFLLPSADISCLYKEYLYKLPNIDFISKIDINALASDKHYTNITELFIDSNENMRRAMRSSGVEEKYITGSASDFLKFRALCGVFPDLIGNSVYAERHFELQFYFNCDLKICPENCEKIWNLTSDYLMNNNVTAMSLLESANIESAGIVTDAIDDLSAFKKIKGHVSSVNITPVLSTKKIIEIEEEGFADYIKKLSYLTEIEIKDLVTFERAITKTFDKFEDVGCRSFLVESFIINEFVKPDRYHADVILKKALVEEANDFSSEDISLWRAECIYILANEIKRRDWCMHYKFSLTPVLETALDSSYWSRRNWKFNTILPQLKLIEFLNEKNVTPKTIIFFDSIEEISLVMGAHQFDSKMIRFGLDGKSCSDINSLRESFDAIAKASAIGTLVGAPSFDDNILCRSHFEMMKRVFFSTINDWIVVREGIADKEDAVRLINKIFYRNIKDFSNL